MTAGSPTRDLARSTARRRPGPAATGRARSGAADEVEHRREIVDRAGHQADAVQRAAGRHQSDGADQSPGRFEARDPVQGRRHPARAGRVGGHGERDLAEGDGEGGPRTRPAGDEVARRRRCAGCRTGVRVPFSPVANWSRLVLPIRTAPGVEEPRRPPERSRWRRYAYSGQASVVGQPATSMLSLTANGMPNSGSVVGTSSPSSSAHRALDDRASEATVIQTPSSPRSTMSVRTRTADLPRSVGSARQIPAQQLTDRRTGRGPGWPSPSQAASPCGRLSTDLDFGRRQRGVTAVFRPRRFHLSRAPAATQWAEVDGEAAPAARLRSGRSGEEAPLPVLLEGAQHELSRSLVSRAASELLVPSDPGRGPEGGRLPPEVGRHRALQLQQDGRDGQVELAVAGQRDHGRVEGAVGVVLGQFVSGSSTAARISSRRHRTSASRVGRPATASAGTPVRRHDARAERADRTARRCRVRTAR